MKNLIFSIIICLFIHSLYAQSVPQGMKYQAVARDLKGELIANQQVSLKIELQSNDQLSEIYYSENHLLTTNQFGLFSLVIGEGIIEKGDFSEIPWNTQDIWIKIAIKFNGETSFTTISNSKLLTVPYAFHAGTANEITSKKSSNLYSKEGVGVPSQNWSLFGNSKSNPDKDKLGTTDNADLVFVTNNEERLRITANGEIMTGKGKFTIGGNLEVQGDKTNINKDLYVGRNVYLNENKEFDPPGFTVNYGDFTVENNSFTKLTGDLDVDGISTLNDNLFVKGNGQFDAKLNTDGDFSVNTEKFTVEGETGNTYVNGTQTVKGDGQFDAKLNTDGDFSVNTDKFIVDNNTGNTSIAGNLNTTGNGTFANLTVSGNGVTKGEHVALFENTTGGTADGIAIKINKENTTDENNFITFYRQDVVAGRIEGYHHNYGDKPAFVSDVIEPMLSSSGAFFTETLGFETPITFDLTFISLTEPEFPTLNSGSWPSVKISPPGLNGGEWPSLSGGEFPEINISSPIKSSNGEVTDIIQPWTWFKPNWNSLISNQNNPVYKLFTEAYENDWKTLADMGITELFIKAAEMELEANIKSEGITYGSKGADYAEWLPRINEEDNLELGHIVGVSGGKISLDTKNADQILVISSKPIVLGNMPDAGEEDLFEKVAFMGQVPTWVTGSVNVGDYILCSGKNDGSGIAVSPNNIEIEDIPHIVGKAWSNSKNPVLSLINVAIGLNRNDIADIVIKQQEEIEHLNLRMAIIEKELGISSNISQKNLD